MEEFCKCRMVSRALRACVEGGGLSKNNAVQVPVSDPQGAQMPLMVRVLSGELRWPPVEATGTSPNNKEKHNEASVGALI